MKTTKRTERLGIDLGYTIYDNPNKRPHTDAFRVIKRLANERYGRSNVFIVSKVNEEQKIRAKDFVLSKEFQEGTGILLSQVYFCDERWEKSPIVSKLGITCFIDDRPDVLIHMDSAIQKILFNVRDGEAKQFASEISMMDQVRTWAEIEKLLLGSFIHS